MTCLSSAADINKFLWMVRIGGSTEKGEHIKEEDYFTPQGEFRVDQEGSPVLLNCLMYTEHVLLSAVWTGLHRARYTACTRGPQALSYWESMKDSLYTNFSSERNFADVSTRCSFAPRKTRASSRNVGKDSF